MNTLKRLLVGMALFGFIAMYAALPFSLLTGNAAALTSSNFAIYAGESNDEKERIKEAIRNGNNYGDPGWKTMRVLVKDFAGTGPTTIGFNENITKKMCVDEDLDIGPIDNNDCNSREPFYTLTYYCALPAGKIQLQKPSSGAYYEFLYAIGLKNNGDGNTRPEFTEREGFNGSGGILTTKKIDPNGDDPTTRSIIHGEYSPDQLGQGTGLVKTGDAIEIQAGQFLDAFSNIDGTGAFGVYPADRACTPPNSIVGRFGPGATEIKNYSKLSDSAKEAFKELAAQAAADAQSDGEEDNNTCRSSGTLSWILCPIIEYGFRTTDFVFNSLVRPLLEDVPVSTDPRDGTFKAWQSFRTLGNIVLVGTLIAVVYAQVRSDR